MNKILSGGEIWQGEGSGGEGGRKWGRRGREVGGKGEGTGNGVPPVHPLSRVEINEQYRSKEMWQSHDTIKYNVILINENNLCFGQP